MSSSAASSDSAESRQSLTAAHFLSLSLSPSVHPSVPRLLLHDSTSFLFLKTKKEKRNREMETGERGPW